MYGHTRVLLDSQEVATNVVGYREFRVPLGAPPAGQSVLIEVDVDNTLTPNSRWYTGSGIYRPVWLEKSRERRFADDGIRLRTRSANTVTADVVIETEIAHGATAADTVLGVDVTLRREGRTVAHGTAQVDDGQARIELAIPSPALWSAETPHLYELHSRLLVGTRVVDERVERVGLRVIEADGRYGLRINGASVLLRGACIHHDNGILGAATFRTAEYRRVKVLKENGFNAIRSAHNPISRDLLDACDELGMYVMDELADYWYLPKTEHDLAHKFDDLWRDGARAMVAKDRNRPSVIMYSIGNEVSETASPKGVATTRALHRFIHDLDDQRPTTVAISLSGNVFVSFGRPLFTPDAEKNAAPQKDAAALTNADTRKAAKPAKTKEKTAGKDANSMMNSTMFNIIANRIGPLTQRVSRSRRADRFSRDAFAEVDIAGYNYAWSRYKRDHRKYPDRIILGSESHVVDLPELWHATKTVDAAIGEFLWTGWDYLGETGLGTWSYGDEPRTGFQKPYPHITSGSGMIDILGTPGAMMMFAQAVWGEATAPRIAVRPLNKSGQATRKALWRSTDALPSWSWVGLEGTRAEVEVYSDADEVELVLNGRSMGRRPAGPRARFTTRFRLPYEPGELTAIDYVNGVERGRSTLRSARTARLRLVPETVEISVGGQDLCYIRVEIADDDGTIEMLADDEITITIDGPATLAAFGSASPSTQRSFLDNVQRTHYGRALAILRSGHTTGKVTVTASSHAHGTATLEVHALQPVNKGVRS